MIKIKMNDIHTLEADYENMSISLIDDTGVSLHIIKCFSPLDVSRRYAEFSRLFEESIKGREISVKISGDYELESKNKRHQRCHSFMEYSAR